MAKTYYTNGTGSTQTIISASDDKIKTYEDLDLVNVSDLAEGEIIAVKDQAIDAADITNTVVENVTAEIDRLIANSGVPAGTITSIKSVSTLNGWLPCDGSTFDRDQYPFLYAALGNRNILPIVIDPVEWEMNTELITDELYEGRHIYKYAFYDNVTRGTSWEVCTVNGDAYFPYTHNIRNIVKVEGSTSHDSVRKNAMVSSFIYGISNMENSSGRYKVQSTSQLQIWYGNQSLYSTTEPRLIVLYYTKEEEDYTNAKYKYIRALSGVETAAESQDVVNAISQAEADLEQVVTDTADDIVAQAINNYFTEYTLAEGTTTSTSATQAVVAGTTFADSLLNYNTVRFYMKRSTGNTDYIPHYDVSHEEMVNMCGRNVNYSLLIPGYASEYREMTFTADGLTCTAVTGNACCYKVIGIGKRS